MKGIHFKSLVAFALLICAACTVATAAFGDSLKFKKKEIPKITWKNISPPFKNYSYFEAHEPYPFQYNADAFSAVNAWWLAETAALVYADEKFVGSQFAGAGLPNVTFLNKKSTQCYVANNDKFAIIAFRGSEIWKRSEKFDLSRIVADLLTDIDIRLSTWDQGGKVHNGFKIALEEIWQDLHQHIRKLHEKKIKIWFTGHSLGAALATLAADRYGEVQGLYTFGSPRVGDKKFKDDFKVKAYRIVNNDDIVARVPLANPYQHVGELRFIDGNGRIHEQMIPEQRVTDQPRDELYGIDNADQPEWDGLDEFIPTAFKDHVPLLYAIHLWNNIPEFK